MNREVQKKEAIKRMKMMKIMDEVIEDFEQNDSVQCSETLGFMYWLSDEEKEMVHKFEEKYHALVYHVIKFRTEFGTLLNFLYVSDSKEEWAMDREDIKDGYTFAYCKNLDDDICSEFGSIRYKPVCGGLVRVG
jgi:hypothetical protein